MSRHQTLLETIGNTPLVRLNRMAPANVNLYVKLESHNPTGSIKDRLALAIIEDAEQSGELKPGQTVIEATSGNTGIGLAMVCAQKGYPLVVTMAENFSIERRKMLRFLGARVVLTPASEKGTGMMNKAMELAEAHGYFFCRQHANPVNADVHYRTTAREIIDDFAGEKLHCWVSGFGTGGTLLGVARALKEADAATRIVAAEPDNSPLLGSGVAQPREPDGLPSASHPYFRPHLMQGWSPDFLSMLTERAMDERLIDDIRPVSGEAAIKVTQDLARREGIFVGTSSGATLAAALEVAQEAPPGANIVCMLPDTGERYLSTPLFEHISDDMNAAELAVSRSTPNYRFDPSVSTAPDVKSSADIALDTGESELVSRVVAETPVLMFALEWCEFSWSVRKLFTALGIEWRSIDLDAVEYQADDFGGRIRAVLSARTGEVTIPQVFIGGRYVGGCTELFDALQAGTLYDWLDEHGIRFDPAARIDPYALMPAWLHPRKSA